jgi:hypothetical protein
MNRPWLPIEKGIPMPPPARVGGRGSKLGPRIPWRDMKPGDSVFCAADEASRGRRQQILAKNAGHMGEILGVLFATRLVHGGVRVWRVG